MVANNLRLKLVSRAAIYGTLLQRNRVKKRHFIAGQLFVVVLVLLSSIVLQVYFQVKPVSYHLDPKTYELIGESREDTEDYLKQNKEQTAYEFVVPKTTDTESKVHTGRVADAYNATLPLQAKEGITVTDNKNNISVTLVPEFFTGTGQKVDGDHFVYPHGSTKVVYTLKYNGLKEDIVVPEFQGSDLTFKFKLRLPSGVEARLDEAGNIGIYSSDPTLFGNISYGSDEDRAKVDKARENGQKTNLVMQIPAPIVKDANGTDYTDKSVFKLGDKEVTETKDTRADLPADIPRSMVTTNEYNLTIESKNLDNLPYPISIDPTMMVTSAADFTTVNNEKGVDIDSSQNLIRRSNLTGGTVGSWAATGSALDQATGHGVVAYNGYIYAVGFASLGNPQNKLQYATLSTDGTIGAWSTTTTQLSSARGELGVAVYNGYMYVMAGLIGNFSRTNLVEYIKINSNGNITGSWTTASNTGLASRYDHASFVANGYLYAIGGCTNNSLGCSGTVSNETLYAKISADGSLASDSDGGGSCSTTWCATATIGTAATALRATYYNGYAYLVGGDSNTVQYTKVNSDGTVAGWLTTTNQPTTGYWFGITAYAGYLYILGGISSGNQLTTTNYVSINADGSLGTWRSTSNMTSERQQSGAVAYNGYLIMVGGSDGSPLTSSEKVQINSAGVLHGAAWDATSDEFGTGTGRERFAAATVAYNGYIYVLGGCEDGFTRCEPSNKVDYVAINADGSLGTWTIGTSLAAGNGLALSFPSAVAYDGYIYVVAGCVSGQNAGCGGGNDATLSGAIGANGASPTTWGMEQNNAALPNLWLHKAFTKGNKLYTTGGCDAFDFTPDSAACTNGRITNKTFVTTMTNTAAAGSRLAAWADASTQLGGGQNTDLPAARADFGLAVWGNYVYVTGGYTTTSISDVRYSSFDANGILQPWQSTTALTGNLFGHTLAASNGYLYAYGGCVTAGTTIFDDCTANTTVSYAKINTNGTVSSWSTTQSMPAARAKFGGMAVNGVLYAIAGNSGDNDNYQDSTVFQYINNGGSGQMGSLTSLTALPSTRKEHASVAYNGYLYVLGGCGASCSATADVSAAQIGGDGTLGAWSDNSGGNDLPAARTGHDAFAYNGYMYVLGGDTGSVTNTVLFARINSNGTLSSPGVGSCTGAWCTTTAFSGARTYHQAVNQGQFVYVSGGCTAACSTSFDNSVQYAQINSADGTIGSWTSQTGFATARYLHGSIAYNNYLYIIGGCSQNTPSELNPYGCDNSNFEKDVQYSKISSTGSLASDAGCGSTWCTTTSMRLGRYSVDPVAMNGYMYILGGTERDDTMFAPITGHGELGQWQAGTALAVTTPDYPPRLAASNGRIYIVGGANTSGTAHSNAGFYPIQTIPRSGSFSKLYDFDFGVKPTKLITRGTKASGAVVGVSYGYVNNLGSTFDGTGSISDTGYGGSGAQTISIGSRTLSSYFFIRYTIDETTSGVFPDSGNETTISDFDLYFVANPGSRLRNGRMFAPGNDGKYGNRGLQTNP